MAGAGNAENAKFNFIKFTQFMFQVWEDIFGLQDQSGCRSFAERIEML
jgi:hypothetical protein